MSKILVIDDEQGIRYLLDASQSEGLRAYPCCDGLKDLSGLRRAGLLSAHGNGTAAFGVGDLQGDGE